MKKIIDLKLARDLRASINAQIAQLGSITDELARCDIRHNSEDQLSDAQLLNDHVECASEALMRADALLATHVPASLIFSPPPTPVGWFMRQLQRVRGGHE